MQLVFLLFLIAIVGTMWGRTRFLKIYGQESTNLISSRITGAELAEAILRKRGVEGISIAKGQGLLPDFYDPGTRRLTLAPQHFGGSSFSALALAALQAGKAIQQHEDHKPLLWRNSAVRASIYLTPPLFVIGLFTLLIGLSKTLLPIVILGWSLITFWNFLTVPTEIDAGLRAKRQLDEMRVFRNLDERVGVERVIGAASTANIDGLSIVASWLARTFVPWMKEKAD
jgi:Zn-dependent membrane protease YugP